MDSVNKKKRSCSVLLLWDDRGVNRFQVRIFWLKILGFLLLLLLGWTGFSGYFVYGYMEKYAGLRKMRSETERLSAETNHKLERLMDIESRLRNQRKLLVAEGVCAARDFGRNTAETASPAAPKLDSGGPAAQPPQMAAGNSIPAETPHPAKITNMAVRALDSARGHISFDLNNQNEQLILNGRVSLTAITNTGQAVEITRADWNALSFRIRYYKKISAVFTLPPDIDMADVAFVEVSLNGDDMPPYSERVPIDNA